MVHDVRTTFLNLEYGLRHDPMIAEIRRRSTRRLNGKPQTLELSNDFQSHRTITLLDADKCRASLRQRRTSSCLRLCKCPPKILVDTHHFPCGFHLRTQENIHPRELIEGKDGFFDGQMRRCR